MAGELQKLKARHREIARLMIMGWTDTVIAQHLEMTVPGIKYAKLSPIFITLYAELCKEADLNAVDMKQRLEVLREMALDNVEEDLVDLKNIDRALRNKTSFEVLDRTGLGKPKEPTINIHGGINQNVISPQVMNIIGKHLEESLSEPGEVIEVKEDGP